MQDHPTCAMLRQRFFPTCYFDLHNVHSLCMGALVPLLFEHECLCIWMLQSASFLPSAFFIYSFLPSFPLLALSFWIWTPEFHDKVILLCRLQLGGYYSQFKKHHFLCITLLLHSSVILCCVTLFCFHTLIFTKQKRKLEK